MSYLSALAVNRDKVLWKSMFTYFTSTSSTHLCTHISVCCTRHNGTSINQQPIQRPLPTTYNPRELLPERTLTKKDKLVPVTWQWCTAAGKVTVGLVSHWPRLTKWLIHLQVKSLTTKYEGHHAHTLLMGYSSIGPLSLLTSVGW